MNARCWFVDTGYWLALYNAADRRNARAQALAERLPPTLVTTEAILLEIGDSLAGRQNRAFAVALLKRVRSASNIDVVPLTPDLLGRALQLYAARPDKDWGLTDCVSFEVMRERGIKEALAADQHFIQAGFRALLLE